MAVGATTIENTEVYNYASTERVKDLRQRVRDAMDQPPVEWICPAQIEEKYMCEPIAVRKARAIALKLSKMPTDLWDGQLFAGSMTLECPRVHAERGFPLYTTEAEREDAVRRGVSPHGCFGHIVPDYPRLLKKGLCGIIDDAEAQRIKVRNAGEDAFLDSVVIALESVIDFAGRLADRCDSEADARHDPARAEELRQMAENLRRSPGGPAETFWQAMQSVWLVHMIFHSALNGNAVGRLDQYIWPYLRDDKKTGNIDFSKAGELVDCFCLKFNERAATTDGQRTKARKREDLDLTRRTRHGTSSQIGTDRDRLDATNHWLQNIIVGGLTPEGEDGTNPLSFLLLESCFRNKMTNPLVTARVHRRSPDEYVSRVCEALKDGGGMPAIFNDEALIPALERIGIPTPDARDYTNDGCWEVIIPGRTDFRFQRLSVMLCLERALNRGRSRLTAVQEGPDTGDPRSFSTWDDVWKAFSVQLEAMVSKTVSRVVKTINSRSITAPVPLLSALIDGAVENRTDMTAGGAKFRTYGMLAEGASHAIDSLTAIKTVIFRDKQAGMPDLCDALDADFKGYTPLRSKLSAAPKYGNDDETADAVGRAMIDAFTSTVERYAEQHRSLIKFPSGVGTFSWYIGIGQGLGASADGRLSGEPVSSNFSPSLGRDVEGIPGAILSYGKMHKSNLPAGGPLDLRLSARLVEGVEGTKRMAALIRGFVDTGGNMMTLTVVDTEELRVAQRDPDKYKSLRVRMGGWCAYFTMLSEEQQNHHIRRQEARS